jgi:hypothetical protein
VTPLSVQASKQGASIQAGCKFASKLAIGHSSI